MGRNRERENIRQLVSSYLDGELPPEDAAWVGRQISDDPRYAEVYRAYRGIRMDMRALPVPDVPPSVSAAIRAYTATAPPRRPVVTLRTRITRLTTAAVTVAAAIAAIFTHAFGLPLQFAHSPGVANLTPISVSVATGPTVATLANTKLAYNEAAELHFSSSMDETTVKQAIHFAPASTPNNWLSPSQLVYNPGTTTLSTAPMALHANTDYRVTIPKGLRDLQGNEVQNTSFDFSVGAAPPPVVVNPPTALPTAAPSPTDTVVSAAVPTVAAVSQTVTPAPVDASTAPIPADDGPDATATTARPVVKPTATTARVATATLAPSGPAAIATATSNGPVPTTAATTGTTGTTASGSASATAIAKPTVPATTAPAPTPEPVAATATSAPAPTVTPTTSVPVAPSFQSAYAQNANRLGGPAGVASTFSGTQLNFTNGVMVYVPGRSFYVIYAGGSWSTAANPGGSGTAVPNATGGYVPGGAYGAAWTNAKLGGKLGYATTTQESPYAGSSQAFDNGIILRVGSDVYVLFNNGTYQLFGA